MRLDANGIPIILDVPEFDDIKNIVSKDASSVKGLMDLLSGIFVTFPRGLEIGIFGSLFLRIFRSHPTPTTKMPGHRSPGSAALISRSNVQPISRARPRVAVRQALDSDYPGTRSSQIFGTV